MGAPAKIRIEDNLPEAYVVASAASAGGQTRFKRLTWISLTMLVVAAAAGIVEQSWAGWVSGAAFLVSIVLTAMALYRRTEQDWYDGRAVAESVKSITFKYAVGGEPFEIGDAKADDNFADTLHELIVEVQKLSSSVSPPLNPPVLGNLQGLRAAALEKRRSVYLEQRIEDQRNWYCQRAREHREVARRWRIVMFASQGLGLVGAALKGLGLLDLDTMSIFAAIAASAAAWIAAGDYTETSRAYDFAALEIGHSRERIAKIQTEADWAEFVADCEQSMSREHTMWLARRRAS